MESDDESNVSVVMPRRRLRLNLALSDDEAASETPASRDDGEYQEEDEDEEDEAAEEEEEEGEQDEEDPEPAELDEDDMDPINSGVPSGTQTPLDSASSTLKQSKAIPKSKGGNIALYNNMRRSKNYTKKETKNIKGQTYTVIDDEIQLDDDPRGEAKIDKNGNLLGGREWKVHTFQSPLRPNKDKLYMLSIDAARACGYRDSLYFFRKHPLVNKVNCSQQEKDRLIDLGRLNIHLRSRSVTMIAMRNAFKVLGAVFVKNGRYVFDDYYEDKALEMGHQPGEPVNIVPYDQTEEGQAAGNGLKLTGAPGEGPPAPTGAVASSKQRSGGRSSHVDGPRPSVIRDELITSAIGSILTFGGSGLQPFGKTWDPAAKQRKPAPHLSVENWMYEYAIAVREANQSYAFARQNTTNEVRISLDVVEPEEDLWVETDEEYSDVDEQGERVIKVRKTKMFNPIRGVIEPETHVPHVPKTTQPTLARMEQLSPYPRVGKRARREGKKDEQADGNDADAEDEVTSQMKAAKRRGVATFEYHIDESAFNARESLLPGIWDFQAGPETVQAVESEAL